MNNEFDYKPTDTPMTPPAASATPHNPEEHIPAWSDANSAQQMPRTPYQVPVREAAAENISERTPEASSQHTAYSSYEQWQAQTKQAKSPKKGHSRLLKVICGVTAACIVFVGGAVAGVQLFAEPSLGSGASQAVSDAQTANTPTLSISTNTTQQGLTGEQIYEKVSPSVVSIVSTTLTQQGTSSGSGVIMTADGYIITNAHVIEGADKVTAVTADGMQYNAQIIGSDTQTDLAVIKLNESVTFTPAEFGDSDALKPGEAAYAIGSPGGVQLANSITTGSISAINRDITIDDRVMTLIQTDASINPGNSGGALINQQGQVVGITSAKLGISYYEGLGFAIPIDSAKEIVDQIIAYGYVPGRPAIGVTGYNLDAQTAAYNNVPQGVVITDVDSRSDAAAQGLQPKDIITAVNGKTVTTMDEINAEKESLKAGDTLKLTVYRLGTGQTLDITITLADENDLSNTTATQPPQQSIDPWSYYFPWSSGN